MADSDAIARRSLIFSIAIVALYGLEMERIAVSRLRHPNDPFDLDPEVREVRRVKSQLQRYGTKVLTSDSDIVDRIVHARQVSRVSYEEWESIVQLELI